ncbi:MAG: hypothetical protein ACRDZO_15140 [Egibacteraceae bacterium]
MTRAIPALCFAFAALVSFGHITDFLVRSGQSPTIAPLYAGVIDVMWYGAMVKLRETLRLPSYTVGVLAGCSFVAAVVISTGANVLSGIQGEIPRYAGLIVAGLPPLIACLAGLMFHADRTPKTQPRQTVLDRWFGGDGDGFAHTSARAADETVVTHVATLGRHHQLSVDGCPTCGHEVGLPAAAGSSNGAAIEPVNGDPVAALVAEHVSDGGKVKDPALTWAVMHELGLSDRQARRRLEPFRKGEL